ncbi:MAG: PIN domain-containing protein [Planctomycetes bacterium]|nr:PIN domain-containing protein [Planctomycetota bacterium]
MKFVFADTSYWVARLNPRDDWAKAAADGRSVLGREVRLLTTDEVLAEFLTYFAQYGSAIRAQAVEAVRALQKDANVEVIAQSRESFNRALDLYAHRGDKGYSLTDCSLMIAMNDRQIKEALTSDHHFEQEGFTILMKRLLPT